MGKKKIVLDTNIFISALGWDGKPREILRRVLNDEFELIISQKQMEELQRVMDYPKFRFAEGQKIRFFSILIEIGTIVKTSGKLSVIEEDQDDNIILESAVENKAGFIISGDDHLLKIKQFKEVRIVTPSEFLEII